MIGFERGPLSTHVVKGRCISNPTPSRRAKCAGTNARQKVAASFNPDVPSLVFLIVQAAYQRAPEASIEPEDERPKRNDVANRTDTVIF